MSPPNSRRIALAVLAMLGACLLSACGQKGPLTRPRSSDANGLATAPLTVQELRHVA